MMILWTLLGIFVGWPLLVWGFYFLFEARNDTSGDGGLAFLFIGLLPWIVPVLAVGMVWDHIKEAKKRFKEDMEKNK